MGFVAIVAIGCSTEPGNQEGVESLSNDSQEQLARMEVQDPGLEGFLNHAYAYAIFPSVGKGALIAGGAYGHGEVFQGGRFIGYADITQATIGAQVGGEAYAELLVFKDADALDRFEGSRLTLAADASAVALQAGTAAAAKFEGGVVVFVSPKAGLMLEAAVGGQSFTYEAK